ncbi:MAG: FliH/SctL family protein [Candidatus Eremiobacterota bacterium]
MAKLFHSAKISSEYFIVNKEDEKSYETYETTINPGEIHKAEEDNRFKKAEAILQNATRNAIARVQEAQEKAKFILQEAHREAQGIKEQAFQDGYKEGLIKGKQDGLSAIEKEFESFLQELKGMTEQTLAERKRIIKELEPQVVDLSLKIAEKILRREASSYEDMIFEQVETALNKLNDRTKITLRVNRMDVGRLNSYRDRIMSLQDDIKELEIVEDLRVDEGGCIIETASGTVDGRINTQLTEIGRSFSNIMDN